VVSGHEGKNGVEWPLNSATKSIRMVGGLRHRVNARRSKRLTEKRAARGGGSTTKSKGEGTVAEKKKTDLASG